MQKDFSYLNWFFAEQAVLCDTLTTWSAINSGTFNLEGLAKQRAALQQAFAILKAEETILPVQPLQRVDNRGQLVDVPLAPVLRYIKRPKAPLQVLLVGHMDTVYAANSPFQHPIQINANKIQGPGVTDMKGGLLVMLYALQTLERSPLAEKIGWQVLINADEEIGSPGSAPLLAEAAPRYHTGLVFEPALTEDGALASQRKGSGNFTLVVRGRAAHAGRALAEGRNAIVALAEMVQAVDQLNNKQPDVTFNVGVIEGGQGLNVVPDLAIARFNVRTVRETDEQWVLSRVNEIVAKIQQREGLTVELHGSFSRKPRQVDAKMQKLCDFITETGNLLGISTRWQMSGGVCDGNNLAHAGLTTVDTLGVRGGNIHSESEYIIVDSLVERARLAALLLMRLAEMK